jgi:chromate transporter
MTIEERKEEETKQEEEAGIVEDDIEDGNAKAEQTEQDSDEADDNRIHMKVAADAPWSERMWEVFQTFWPLGLVAFGGPQAHVAILRDHLVVQRDWLDEEQFTELFAIGQVRLSMRDFFILFVGRLTF